MTYAFCLRQLAERASRSGISHETLTEIAVVSPRNDDQKNNCVSRVDIHFLNIKKEEGRLIVERRCLSSSRSALASYESQPSALRTLSTLRLAHRSRVSPDRGMTGLLMSSPVGPNWNIRGDLP